MERYKHFAHRHNLFLCPHPSFKMSCLVCKLQSWADFYGCKKCDYYICRSCYELPRKMQHPLHNEHLLTLFDYSPKDSVCCCSACSNRIGGFSYHCSKCEFVLHFNCATLMPTTTTTTEEEMITHPHPLISCDRKNKDVKFSCSVCHLPIKGIIYVCLDDLCGAILHISCAQLPQQITHKFHPQHSLTLRHSLTLHRCKACLHFQGNFLYNCSECEFNLDVRCASLVPKPAIEENQLLLVEPFSSKFTHPHSLIPCDTKGNFTFLCSACEISIQDEDEDGTLTVYVCLECGLLLHKSCAKLPPLIRHPFHPPHNLQLDEKRICYSCKACKCSVWGFNYRCRRCNFAIDVTCASQNYSTFKDPLHQHHPLVIFNHNKRDNKKPTTANKCNICGHGPLRLPFLRCVPCDFTIGLCCYRQLPPEFKHSCHDRHSLTLTRSSVKDNSDDDSDSEYYCDLCEKRRELRDPTYYCHQCHYVAHLTCVFDEILPLLERERDEEIEKLQAEVDALSPKLDELKEKVEQRVSEYQVASRLDDKNDAWVMEAEIENESTDTKAVVDDPTIAKLDEEIIMVRAEIDALTTKLNQLEKRREQHIGVIEVEIKNASREKKKTSLSATRDDASFFLSSKDPTFLDAEEEIRRLQADIDALKVELKTKTTKLDELKESREQHIGGISSLDTESALAFLAHFDDVVKKGCNVKSESDGTFTTLAELDKVIEEQTTKLKALMKKRSNQVRYGTFL